MRISRANLCSETKHDIICDASVPLCLCSHAGFNSCAEPSNNSSHKPWCVLISDVIPLNNFSTEVSFQ